MRYVALKPLRVGERDIRPGDEVPEAVNFVPRRLAVLLATRRLVLVQDTHTRPQAVIGKKV